MTLISPLQLSWCHHLLIAGLLLAGAGTPWAPALHAQSSPADTTDPVIAVWSNQQISFGTTGIPQPVINIVGNASAAHGVSSLQYSLNGDTAVSLSLGPDLRRLARKGDFNIDIRADALKKWPARNNVTIRARDTLGQVTTLDVEITNQAPRRWPLPYEVSWSSPASLGDSAQVIDGKWSWTSRGIIPTETGYDRLVGIGDTAWRDYEVTAEVAILSVDSSDRVYDQINGGPGIGLLMRWNGHSNTPVFNPPITQPLSGYLPLGAIGWYHWRRGAPNTWELVGNNLHILSRDTTQRLEFGVTYRFKMRVVTISDSGIRYSFKKWKRSELEPEQWLLTGFQSLDNPQHGSFCLIAHHVTAIFGKVSVTPLGQDAPVPVVEFDPASTDIPLHFSLEQNFPNPFNPKTVVRSQLPAASHVKLAVYDVLGRQVALLVDERRAAGHYEDSFDASGLASGIYVYRLTAASYSATRKMLLVR